MPLAEGASTLGQSKALARQIFSHAIDHLKKIRSFLWFAPKRVSSFSLSRCQSLVNVRTGSWKLEQGTWIINFIYSVAIDIILFHVPGESYTVTFTWAKLCPE